MEPKVISVNRKNGIAWRVIIEAEGKRIIFILGNGELREAGRIRIDGARIWGEEALWISTVSYQRIQRIANAILKERARR